MLLQSSRQWPRRTMQWEGLCTQYVDAGQTVQVLFWYAVSRTDTRMTGSYLYYSVNWVQSARRTTERGRARRVLSTNKQTRRVNRMWIRNSSVIQRVLRSKFLVWFLKIVLLLNCQNASKRQNFVPNRRCVDVFPILLHAAWFNAV